MNKKAVRWVVEDPDNKNIFWPSDEMKKRSLMNNPSVYEEAARDPVYWWAKLAEEGITWIKKWSQTYEFNPPFYKWFVGGKLNITYDALERNILAGRQNKAAIMWQPELINEHPRVLTYHDLYREVNKFANVLKELGVKKGDRVGIYMPMIPEVQIAMLACARIGAIHSVVFSAFSGKSLRERMIDAEAKVLVTADGYYRRGKIVDLKKSADIGVDGSFIKDVVVVKRLGNKINFVEERDHWWSTLMDKVEGYCEPEELDAEDIHFILYTSGTTGKPKGIEHHIGGYAVIAYWTTKWDFDLHENDVFWCTADVGWITGHTYNCYGPFMNGATILIYEGAPDYPSADRIWKIIEDYGVTVFYTAPTLIRLLMKLGDQWVKKHNLDTLRILATVGEPINEEAWLWYFKVVGGERCPIIDTWWQTETGGTLITSLPGIGPFIPTVAGRPFPGTTFSILTEDGKETNIGEGGYLIQKSPFAPSMLRTVFKDDKRYETTYFDVYGKNLYYTGDGAYVHDEIGNIRITGRVDDVMKVAGHRLSTAEVENALTQHHAVVECAVVSAPHDVKGEVPVAFVVVRPVYSDIENLERDLKKQVTEVIGPTARPDRIVLVDDLPRTRSGKIMRRILKSLTSGKPVGDVTTLMNPESVEVLREKMGSD